MQGARLATAHDVERIAELATAAKAELSANRGGSIWVRREARRETGAAAMTDLLTASDRLLAVGTIDGVVVGYAAARTETMVDGTSLGVLEDLYVEPGGRGVGVGEALMAEVLAWAGGAGCVGIDSLVLPGDRAAKNFFESFGLVARAILVHRALGADPQGRRR